VGIFLALNISAAAAVLQKYSLAQVFLVCFEFHHIAMADAFDIHFDSKWG